MRASCQSPKQTLRAVDHDMRLCVSSSIAGSHGQCVTCRYLPTDSTMARFFWVIRLYARNGFFVMIDDHTEDPTFSQSPTTWLQVRRRP